MTVMPDKWIRRMAIEKAMIHPFEESLVTKEVISYGLSSYGYDIRLSNKVKRLKKCQKIDPKSAGSENYEDQITEKIIVHQHESILGMSFEYLKIPREVLALCIGKSSYARLGIMINITPLEPEWEGYITISIINGSNHSVVLYPNEGIAQVIFLKAHELCEVSYKDRKGKYQAQKDIEITRL